MEARERRSLTSDPCRAGQISSPPQTGCWKLCALLPPVFFLFYPKEERVEDSTCFPEQIQPRCILPLCARHRPALIALSIFQRFRRGMRLFRLAALSPCWMGCSVAPTVPYQSTPTASSSLLYRVHLEGNLGNLRLFTVLLDTRGWWHCRVLDA